MQPHETKKTLSLNEARNYIIAMSKPMGEAVELIEMNVKKINEVKEQCRLFDVDIERFQAELKFKGFDREVKPLNYPMTVCADTACKKYVNVACQGRGKQYIHKFAMTTAPLEEFRLKLPTTSNFMNARPCPTGLAIIVGTTTELTCISPTLLPW